MKTYIYHLYDYEAIVCVCVCVGGGGGGEVGPPLAETLEN